MVTLRRIKEHATWLSKKKNTFWTCIFYLSKNIGCDKPYLRSRWGSHLKIDQGSPTSKGNCLADSLTKKVNNQKLLGLVLLGLDPLGLDLLELDLLGLDLLWLDFLGLDLLGLNLLGLKNLIKEAERSRALCELLNLADNTLTNKHFKLQLDRICAWSWLLLSTQ